jgi:uncharacterized lipoprotein YmbA
MMKRCDSLAILLLLVTFTSCLKRSQPVVLHTLRPLVLEASGTASSGQPLALEIMPVQIPELIQRPQIVSLQGPDRLTLSEIHHWGNPLDKDIQRVLLENLSALLGSDSIVVYPHGDRVKALYRLALEVQRLDGQPGGMLKLDATWILTGPEGGQVLLLRKVHLQEPVQGSDSDALVAAHSRVLATLSREIAQEIKNMNQTAPVK